MPRNRVAGAVAVAALLGTLLFLAPQAGAHGGTYRPPAGEEPPPPPPDPPPPPPDPPPPPPPPEDPPPPPPPPPDNPAADPTPPAPPPAPPGPPSTPPAPPSTGPAPPKPPTSNPTPSSGRNTRRTSGPDPEDWSTWWYYSRDRFLVRRTAAASRGSGLGAAGGPADGNAVPADDRGWREGALAALRKSFPDTDTEIFTGAAVALGKGGDPRDAAALLETLKGRYRNPTIRESAVLGLGLLGRDAPGAREALLGILRDRGDSARLRGFAALALGLSGDRGAAPALLAAARERGPQKDPAAGALVALGLLGEDLVVPDLAGMLDDDRNADARALRPFAAFALGRIGGSEAAAALGRALGDGDAQVRRAAVLALGECPADLARPFAPALSHVAREDRDRPCRSFAMVTLGRIGGDGPRETLYRCFSLGDRGERNFAALGLALCGRGLDDEERARVASLLRDQFEQREDAGYRGALAIALGLLRDARAAPSLRAVLRARGDPALRAHCALALGLAGAGEAAEDLRAALGEKGAPDLQREAALALGLLGDPSAAKVLAALVADPKSTEHLRASAAMALGQLRCPEAVAPLVGLLRDADASGAARGQAAVGLGLLLDPRPEPALAAISQGLDYLAPVGVLVEALTIP